MFTMGCYHRVQHSPILTATVGSTDRYIRGRGTVYRAFKQNRGEVGDDSQYPTGKPVDLYRQLLEPPVLSGGERLIEPFCGHGPGAAIAAERGLSYWGADVSKDAVMRTRRHFEQQRLPQQQSTSN